jgi:hypothetical protein
MLLLLLLPLPLPLLLLLLLLLLPQVRVAHCAADDPRRRRRWQLR